MKAVGEAAKAGQLTEVPPRIKVDELDWLRLAKAQHELERVDQTIGEIRLREQNVQLRIQSTELAKANYSVQLRELQDEERRQAQLRETLSLYYKTNTEAEFKKKYGVDENASFHVDPITFDLTVKQ